MRKPVILIASIFILILLFITIKNVKAQTHVESKSYDLMLSTLLAHSVNERNVQDVKENPDYLFLDAREKQEYDVSHLENAVWIGYQDFNLSRVANIPKNQEIVVYCSVGYRSEKIAEKLIAAGFTNVSNLYGGIFEWVNEDQKIVDTLNQITDKIHGYSKSWGVWLNKGEKVFE